MNSIRQIQALNKRELENAVTPEASWHADYRDTAYIYIGGLPFDLSEGDIVTIFSQYGEPVHVNLVRDKDTGKSKGFAFLKYEDQRSTDLAVDNLGGATVMGRVLRVDHTRYKRKEEEGEEDNVARIMGPATGRADEDTDTERRRKSRRRDDDESDVEERLRPMLKEEKELAELLRDHDDEDPMKEYLIQEKKEEVARALEAFKASEKKSSSRRKDSRERSHRHRHHRRRRSEDRSRERSHRDRDDSSRRERHRRDRSESPHPRRDRSRERSRRERD
ncbi:Zinc finger CCCH domain-containing protein 42 [Talaromyces pinophilus]|nr:Zinc finger CCCH domain-containing protein 42 [Talaromyces pinophilus]